MQESSRVVYQREFRITPVWLWVAQRLSGLLLGPLVLVHMWLPHGGATPYLDALLLIFVIGHGYSGLKRMNRHRNTASAATVSAWVWGTIVALFGIALLSSYPW